MKSRRNSCLSKTCSRLLRTLTLHDQTIVDARHLLLVNTIALNTDQLELTIWYLQIITADD
jgi:hypothetical protein